MNKAQKYVDRKYNEAWERGEYISHNPKLLHVGLIDILSGGDGWATAIAFWILLPVLPFMYLGMLIACAKGPIKHTK